MLLAHSAMVSTYVVNKPYMAMVMYGKCIVCLEFFKQICQPGAHQSLEVSMDFCVCVRPRAI